MTVTNSVSGGALAETSGGPDSTSRNAGSSAGGGGSAEFQSLLQAGSGGDAAQAATTNSRTPEELLAGMSAWQRLFAGDPSRWPKAAVYPEDMPSDGPYDNPVYNRLYQYQLLSNGGDPNKVGGAAVSPFGENPFMESPTATGPLGVYPLAKSNFPTLEAAQKVATMLGGTLTTAYDYSGAGCVQNQPNYRVALPDGRTINPGEIIDTYSHGYPQAYVDQWISAILNRSAITSNAIPGHWLVSEGKVTYSQTEVAATTRYGAAQTVQTG